MSLLSGSTRGAGGRALSRHLLSPKNNETVTVIEPRGLVAEGLHGQLDELARGAITTRTARPVYHVHCDPAIWCEVVRAAFWNRFEAEFDLAEARYCGAIHTKNGRRHEHRCYDLTRDDASVVNLQFDRLRRQKIAVLVSYENGLPAPPIKHVRAVSAALINEGHCEAAEYLTSERDRPVRIAFRTPQDRAVEERKLSNKGSVAEQVLAAWKSADTGLAFVQALDDRGMTLANGDKVVVVVDETGATWPVARLLGQATRQEGARVKTAEVKRRLSNITLASLDEVRQARRDKTKETEPHAVVSLLVNAATQAPTAETLPQNQRAKTTEIACAAENASAIAIPELARQLHENTISGPIERHLRDLERRERSARKRLADLNQLIQEPADLVQARQNVAKLASCVRDIEVEESRKATLLAKMKTTRPSGGWAWLTGKSRAHDRVMKRVDTEYDEIAEKLDAVRTALWRAEGRVELRERNWRGQLREIEADRVRRRAAIADELLWLADARACIGKDIGVTVSPAALENAIKELRAERDKQQIADRPQVSRFTGSRSYRPHF